MEIEEILDQLPATANACPAPDASGGATAAWSFLIEVESRAFQLTVQSGRITDVHLGPLNMRAWALRHPCRRVPPGANSGRRCPGPGFNDIFAMASRGHARIEGDVGPAAGTLALFSRNSSSFRDRCRRSRDDGRENRADCRPLRPSRHRGCRPIESISRRRARGVPLVCLHTAGAHSSQYRHLMCDPRVTDRFRVSRIRSPLARQVESAGWMGERGLSSDERVSTSPPS